MSWDFVDFFKHNWTGLPIGDALMSPGWIKKHPKDALGLAAAAATVFSGGAAAGLWGAGAAGAAGAAGGTAGAAGTGAGAAGLLGSAEATPFVTGGSAGLLGGGMGGGSAATWGSGAGSGLANIGLSGMESSPLLHVGDELTYYAAASPYSTGTEALANGGTGSLLSHLQGAAGRISPMDYMRLGNQAMNMTQGQPQQPMPSSPPHPVQQQLQPMQSGVSPLDDPRKRMMLAAFLNGGYQG